MRYLVLSPSEYDHDIGDVTETTPLIPSFAISGVDCDYFLGADKLGKVRNAKIKELSRDPDEVLEQMVQIYPGIPQAMLEKCLIASCVAAGELPSEYTYQCLVSGHKTTLRALDTERKDYVMWDDLDPAKYL
jgi:hypothetical protein